MSFRVGLPFRWFKDLGFPTLFVFFLIEFLEFCKIDIMSYVWLPRYRVSL